MPGDWTVVRIAGNRGLPELEAADFLGCVSAVRGEFEGVRWHYRWEPAAGETARDGLRVELRYGSPEMDRVVRELEAKIPPPDSVTADPMQKDRDLDDVQTEEEMHTCLDLLWAYSEFMSDLRVRNPALTTANMRELTPGAFLTFVTGDRRHMEIGMADFGVTKVPAVPFGRAVGLIRRARLMYRLPATSQEDACAAARIHHLAACTFAARFYPFRRVR